MLAVGCIAGVVVSLGIGTSVAVGVVDTTVAIAAGALAVGGTPRTPATGNGVAELPDESAGSGDVTGVAGVAGVATGTFTIAAAGAPEVVRTGGKLGVEMPGTSGSPDGPRVPGTESLKPCCDDGLIPAPALGGAGARADAA